MKSANDYLINARRLISDAEYLCAGGRARSAATLTVVALEQFGAFVEALTLETYPGAKTRMGLFLERNQRHSSRQDILAGHVFNFAESTFTGNLLVQAYIAQHVALDFDYLKRVAEGGAIDLDDFMQWVASRPHIELNEKQKHERRENPDIATAHKLLHLTRSGFLKDLREYGLYEDAKRSFSETEIKETLELASNVSAILARSFVVSEPPKIAGVNMPEIALE
jgi:hypothetical protein